MKRLAILCLLAVGCSESDTMDIDEEWGMEGPLEPTPPPGKEDSEFRKGLLVNTDTTRTQVWSAKNKWEDRDTPAAKAAGLAWPANSGLNWDEKYAKWVESLEWIPAQNGYSTTVRLTTPWNGKTLPSPSLECAEMSLFLRITFSAWYELPLFWETVDSTGKRVYIGHNGVRTSAGRYAASPEFAIKYKDHTKTPGWETTWPKDTTLRAKHVAGGDDSQPAIGASSFGAYLDEIHLNKRAGYFTVLALDYLGSVNLADSANTFNIKPDDVTPGDMLLERWQRSGIGHTLVVKEVRELTGGSLDVTMISGSMPRRQGVRESGVAAKQYFTSDYAGGPGMNSDGQQYAKLGGGVKRFRVAKNIGGYWTNTWMSGDEATWINSTDYTAIAARPARFEQILGQVSPAQQKAELLQQIADARHHLSQYPASCSARERRENAFEQLYQVSRTAFGQTPAQVDAQYREMADYVLGELEYTKSKTCCWNSSTSAMYDIIMKAAQAEKDAADAQGVCVAPTVFASRADGYAKWQAYATSIGRGAEWKAWTEDEACPQRNVASDTVVGGQATEFCELDDNGGSTPVCTDAQEPNDGRTAARAASGTLMNLQICTADEDWFKIANGGTVRIEFTHANGDLDLAAYDSAGTRTQVSETTGNSESVNVPAGGTVRVFGYNGAKNAYKLVAP